MIDELLASPTSTTTTQTKKSAVKFPMAVMAMDDVEELVDRLHRRMRSLRNENAALKQALQEQHRARTREVAPTSSPPVPIRHD